MDGYIKNKDIKFVTGGRASDAPAKPLLRELHILNIKELIRHDTAVMMHKIK